MNCGWSLSLLNHSIDMGWISFSLLELHTHTHTWFLSLMMWFAQLNGCLLRPWLIGDFLVKLWEQWWGLYGPQPKDTLVVVWVFLIYPCTLIVLFWALGTSKILSWGCLITSNESYICLCFHIVFRLSCIVGSRFVYFLV